MKQNSRIQLENTLIGALGVLSLVLFILSFLPGLYDNYALSISATTRAPREGEVDGREYFFKTREEFEQMNEHDELVEYAQYVGNYYGTPKEYVFSNLKAGKDVLLEIEIQGALKIKKKFPEAVLIFVTLQEFSHPL